MDSINAITKQADAYIQPMLSNTYVMAILKVTIALYAAQLAPKLPSSVSTLLNNTFIKILAIALIVYLSEKDLQLALMLAVLYVISTNVLSGRGFLESYANFSNDYKPSGDFKLLEPKTAIHPGCHNVTLADLEQAFDGDNIKLHTAVQYSYGELLNKAKDKNAKEILMKMAYAIGLPHNVQFTDENAPLIATMLMYTGFHIGGTCLPPQ
jgi:hypothetical protein